MAERRTPVAAVAIPPALLTAARQALGTPDAAASDVVRAALASLAGVDVADYTPRRTGRPPRRRTAGQEVAA
jgi:hypothetical protein